MEAGSLSPHASEIYHEGTLVPPIRIVHEGTFNREAYAVILNNSRFPAVLEGDTKALMAACGLADRRVVELIERYGRETVLACWDAIVENSIAAQREYARDLIPDGEYRFSDHVDADPLTGEPALIDLKLLKEGDRLVADLTDSGPQTRGPVNFITTPGAFNLMVSRYLGYLNPELELNEGLVQWARRQAGARRLDHPCT